MARLARRVVCVDFQRPESWHTDPSWAIGLARRFTKRFKLRHDYMPFEFALVMYCSDDPPTTSSLHTRRTPEPA